MISIVYILLRVLDWLSDDQLVGSMADWSAYCMVIDCYAFLQEICISYLDECDVDRSRHSRQKMLRYAVLLSVISPLCSTLGWKVGRWG